MVKIGQTSVSSLNIIYTNVVKDITILFEFDEDGVRDSEELDITIRFTESSLTGKKTCLCVFLEDQKVDINEYSDYAKKLLTVINNIVKHLFDDETEQTCSEISKQILKKVTRILSEEEIQIC